MTPESIILYIVTFLYGIVIGSFLNVCIYRMPKKESLVTVGSHCMNCGHKLKWYDLFPLFSWIFLKGKCRYCNAGISSQYPGRSSQRTCVLRYPLYQWLECRQCAVLPAFFGVIGIKCDRLPDYDDSYSSRYNHFDPGCDPPCVPSG